MKKCINCAFWIQKTPFFNDIAFGVCCSQDVHEKHKGERKTDSEQSCEYFIEKVKEKK